ncbi:MAG TPA: C4-type zinc ribbon domain-containing protein [Bryobacteraceae bacterium]|nr:C4-type zinc ribbon domain-containing protein [Bryobacteraceae bacterium]
MSPVLKSVLRLQSLDLRAAELRKEIESLPKHIAQIEKQLEIHTRKLEAERASLAGNQKARKGLEDDIKVHEQKISKLKDQMLQAKTNEQYRAFQNEINYAETEIRKAEDRILELMSEAEPLDKNVKSAEAKLGEEKKQVAAEADRARARSADDQRFLEEALAERSAIVKDLDPALVRDYERIRTRWKGVAIADATQGRCSACQISLRPQYFQDLKHADKVMYCESCGRIIYYNPPVDVAAEMHRV